MCLRLSNVFDNVVVDSSALRYYPLMTRSGADLALLMLGGFRSLVDAAISELAARGHHDVRPVHDFAMRAISAGADNASALSRRLSVSKQAAAKTIALLEARGYVARDIDPQDARRRRLHVTPLGFEVLRTGEVIFDELRERWVQQVGADQIVALEATLSTLIGSAPLNFDTPGWMAQDHSEA